MTGEVSGQVLHCERPVKIARRNFHWEGEDECERVDMRCSECDAELTLTIRAHVGPPSGETT